MQEPVMNKTPPANLNMQAFRLGDIRGQYPLEVDENFVVAFAHAFVGEFSLPGKIATCRDMRESSESLQAALNAALASIGIDVIDLGLCPTELGYFASTLPGIEAAIVVTASHNPPEYNGLKCVLRNGKAITTGNGLLAIQQRMAVGYRHGMGAGSIERQDCQAQYMEFLRQHFDPEPLRSGKVALNGLNGTAATMAGLIADEFELPVTWFRQQPGPMPAQGADPTNPILAREMQKFMGSDEFSLGVAWDGDCDRCVVFDSNGQGIPAYYLVGLLTEHFLRGSKGRAIVFDTKLWWNTIDLIGRFGGNPVRARTGHAYMKYEMHRHSAVYGGELSSHHYFGDFFGCDSGMFAWLTVLGLVRDGQSIEGLIAERRAEIFITPEISLALSDVDNAFAAIESAFSREALSVDRFDGLSLSMRGGWRFSIKRSKTEPVVRLNFEARKTPDNLLEEGRQVFQVLAPYLGDDAASLDRFKII
ncbi:MAG: phosphomannomutase [Candidatus Azotimanducaceae bacterium]